MRIALIGYMGSGKSTLGKLLSERMNIPFMDLDTIIETREQQTIAEIFQNRGEEYFRQLESTALKEVLEMKTSYILATGGGTPCFFDQMSMLNKSCSTVYLQCSAQELEKRIAGTSGVRPLLLHQTGGIEQHLRNRENTYSQAHLIVNGELPPIELSIFISSHSR